MLPLVLGVAISLTHFFNEKIKISQDITRQRIVSFVAGISIAYVFLVLLPEIYSGFQTLRHLIFISLLFGFTATHVAEKIIYQHTSPKKLREDLRALHSVTFFFYYFFIGIILVELNNRFSALEAVLFFLPVLFYSAIGLVSLEKIHPKIWEKPVVKLILSLSVVFGVLLADALLGFQTAFKLLFGFIIGTFLYTTIIDFIPREAKGKPEYFVLGVISYSLVILSTSL